MKREVWSWVFLVVAAYLAIAFSVFRFRHPELTAIESLLNTHYVLTLKRVPAEGGK